MAFFFNSNDFADIKFRWTFIWWIVLGIVSCFLYYWDVGRFQNWSDTTMTVTHIQKCKERSRHRIYARSYTCRMEADLVYADQNYHFVFHFLEGETLPKVSVDSDIQAKFYVDGEQVIADFPGRYTIWRYSLLLVFILLGIGFIIVKKMGCRKK